jgi:hypothetical protein
VHFSPRFNRMSNQPQERILGLVASNRQPER